MKHASENGWTFSVFPGHHAPFVRPPFKQPPGEHTTTESRCMTLYIHLGSEPTLGQGIFIVTGIAKCFKQEI